MAAVLNTLVDALTYFSLLVWRAGSYPARVTLHGGTLLLKGGGRITHLGDAPPPTPRPNSEAIRLAGTAGASETTTLRSYDAGLVS